ncbi:MAG: methylmalonyl-CoA mutase family protein [Bacteriovoracaceae bacterium]|jgi:isobutyryl-CoA mutase|nr:methylmalonyl-CoA mutase family protein [Bacteriovoracaceae bacterium]
MSRLRFVTASSLFDGHDASINIMRRLLQSKGAEVIHLGHNRSAKEVVDAAIQEDVQGIALSSYQGGHMEYFTYIRELLDSAGSKNIKIFGGGGGVITPSEMKKLHSSGITRIYSPGDGMKLGLDGIINDIIDQSQFSTIEGFQFKDLAGKKNLNHHQIGKTITYIEEKGEFPFEVKKGETKVLGITGTGGAGKSSLIDEILLRFSRYYPDKKVALISIDPTKKKNQGALLGDRIRLGSATSSQFYIRSLATRDSKTELSPQIEKTTMFLKSLDFDLIIVETSGIGQASDEITEVADQFLYVMTPEYGAASQLEKIEMLESAHFIAINKFEKAKGMDALRDVRKQYRRNKQLFAGHPGSPEDDQLPIYGTIASKFNNPGVNDLFFDILSAFKFPISEQIKNLEKNRASEHVAVIIPSGKVLYLREISDLVENYNQKTGETSDQLANWESLSAAAALLPGNSELKKKLEEVKSLIPGKVFSEIEEYDRDIEKYHSGEFSFNIRGKELKTPTKYRSLSQLEISRVGIPDLQYPSEKYRFIRSQNFPGKFPYAAGTFPFKRKDEEPKRQFAGEGGPHRTNKRFHFLSENDEAKRLSTAFDSTTLYGEDPAIRPDIFGKIGEAGVSICTLEDMEVLYSGFDLCNPKTSVSMTINGPATIVLAMFMNTAIRQNLGEKDFWDSKKRLEVMKNVRGTVQADILKEDQAQNTCIFSLEFALRLMGDVQEYFSKNQIKNYYTVSISGYHIAEAGANPITQLALTLANGFTYVEYYLSRGLKIDEFAENLSFFFSNGLDPEYTVMGRVARKIWAIAMKEKYGANLKSQKLKYHIQTSGRSLHAQEIDFNDIRTTLQAFLALSDNCNSLHTNAYDEAITTPTEESVRRAMAIQLIINREFGLNKTDNPLQGSYIFEELAQIVEDAVLKEFVRISDRGGVLGAMENMYQRSKIQEESLLYESQKDSGEIPIIGVNTYIAENISEQLNAEIEISRCTNDEKMDQINRLNSFKEKNKDHHDRAIESLKDVVLNDGNIFEELLSTVNYCSLGEITSILYDVGGKYRRNM